MISYPFKFYTEDENQTRLLAEEFISGINNGDRVILNGGLGAGKTFFIKSALKSVGIENVNSPSFAIVNEYFSGRKFYHFDFFRLKNSAELFDIGWQDYLNDEESVMFVEWGDRLPEVLPLRRIEIKIDIKNVTSREFNFARYE